ncbi:bifunctional DNA primase/polymerase [Hyphomicrobium sp.]|uniref:bifunctional DNA primase/polymerase n=1 Tax=Hyphomicrobium sp. TaxID=82 RepID=UPI0025BDB5CC|nr:bifunctional DNA primase/polymerase [Hyphomicrobium sp.]MCC7253828.1 bifunctional DNA primase/polymerase [Hyphomicrobium sp.]
MTLLPTVFDPTSVSLASHNLDVALDLARAGAYVFPAQSAGPGRKQPCRGVYWKDVSTRDEQKILAMWERHPDAVPAIDLAKTGLLVIDCDRKPCDGLTWLTAHAAGRGDDLSEPPAVDTPSGGRHLYYRNDFTPPQGNGRGALPPKAECGIDVRGAGGFVVAPGAAFTDGTGCYSEHGSIFDAGPPPAWLCDLLKPPQRPLQVTVPAEPVSDARLLAYGEAALDELLRELAAAQPGTRSDEANRIAFRVGQLVGGGCVARAAAQSALEQAVLSWGVSPRDKALGPRGTIARALKAGEASPRGPDDSVPAVEIALSLPGGDRIDPETGEVLDAQPEPSPTPPAGELPDYLTHPPGLVGAITDWIAGTALYPQRGLALGAALTIVGTAAGRHIAGPNKCGTHLYVVGLAPSGAGKNHPLSQIAVLLAAAGMQEHIGPSQFISMPAVINFLCRSPLSVCAMDEFGSFLKRINNRRASGFEGAISGLLRTAWGASFGAMSTPEWAQRASETIFSPALSIYGVSTSREFYDALEGADVTNGVLNRFLVIETKRRPQETQPTAPADPPAAIVAALKAIYASAGPLGMLCQSRQAPAYRTLSISPDAEQIRRGFVAEMHSKGDADPSLEPFLARTAENALRLASIVTIGQDRREIDAAAMAWGREFAAWSADRLAEGAGLYIADSESQAAAQAVRRAIQERGGRLKRRDLLQAIKHRYKTRELNDVINSLAEAEDIRIEKTVPPGGGTPTVWYSIRA